MATKQFVVDSFRVNLAKKNIDLANDAIKVALCTTFSPSYSAWGAAMSYYTGDIVIPTTRNGHRYRAQNDGQSGSSEPVWPTTQGGTVSDDNITWEELGGEHADNEFFDSISGNEVADGDGYTAGGASLSSLTVAKSSDNPSITQWDAANATWSSLIKTMRTAWVYVDGGTPGTNDFIISYILFDDSPADVSVNGANFTLEWSPNGIIELCRFSG